MLHAITATTWRKRAQPVRSLASSLSHCRVAALHRPGAANKARAADKESRGKTRPRSRAVKQSVAADDASLRPIPPSSSLQRAWRALNWLVSRCPRPIRALSLSLAAFFICGLPETYSVRAGRKRAPPRLCAAHRCTTCTGRRDKV